MGELAIILVIVIIVFGATRLPMIGSGLGKGISNFKKEIDKNKDKKEKGLEEPEKDSEKAEGESSEKTG